MKNLIPLSEGSGHLDRYLLIRNAKHTSTRKPLAEAHDMVVERYALLEGAIESGSLQSMQSSASAQAISAHLKACYKSSTKPLEALKEAIKSRQPRLLLKYCPMCGITLPKTFDHYLPSVEFPEYAVHGLNLVPCCSTCNSIKDDYWLSADGRRYFIYAYSDELPATPFLRVGLHQRLGFDGVGATFALDRPEGVLDSQWALIESHFGRLHLIERYNERGNDEVSEILGTCRDYVDAQGQNVRLFLSNLSERSKAHHGSSFWIAVLMKELANHPDLDGWIAGVSAGSLASSS